MLQYSVVAPAIPNMNAFWLALLSNALLSHSIAVHHIHRDIATKSKIELKPMNIHCGLNNIVRISAPLFNVQSQYYLTKPNGDVITLNITTPTKFKPRSGDYGFINYFKKRSQEDVVTLQDSYDVFSLTKDDGMLKGKEAQMNSNEFLLGPLLVDDHGNWVLSAYTMDYNGDWIEMFQVITLQILEFVPLEPILPNLRAGDTLSLQLAYPIPALTSCQLVAPQSTFDRLFERSHLDMDRCTFVLRNVTVRDTGMWRILAVGRIVYEGATEVTVVPIDN